MKKKYFLSLSLALILTSCNSTPDSTSTIVSEESSPVSEESVVISNKESESVSIKVNEEYSKYMEMINNEITPFFEYASAYYTSLLDNEIISFNYSSSAKENQFVDLSTFPNQDEFDPSLLEQCDHYEANIDISALANFTPQSIEELFKLVNENPLDEDKINEIINKKENEAYLSSKTTSKDNVEIDSSMLYTDFENAITINNNEATASAITIDDLIKTLKIINLYYNNLFTLENDFCSKNLQFMVEYLFNNEHTSFELFELIEDDINYLLSIYDKDKTFNINLNDSEIEFFAKLFDYGRLFAWNNVFDFNFDFDEISHIANMELQINLKSLFTAISGMASYAIFIIPTLDDSSTIKADVLKYASAVKVALENITLSSDSINYEATIEDGKYSSTINANIAGYMGKMLANMIFSTSEENVTSKKVDFEIKYNSTSLATINNEKVAIPKITEKENDVTE